MEGMMLLNLLSLLGFRLITRFRAPDGVPKHSYPNLFFYRGGYATQRWFQEDGKNGTMAVFFLSYGLCKEITHLSCSGISAHSQ